MTTARGRAIIADDEPEILELLQEVLAGQGYEMMTATEGAEALAVVPQRFQRVEREREGRHGPDVEYRRPSSVQSGRERGVVRVSYAPNGHPSHSASRSTSQMWWQWP